MTIDFRFYLSLFFRRIFYFLIFLALFSAAGVALAIMLPPVYRAEAILIVESQQIPSDLAESTVRVETTEQLQIIQQRILTRDRLLDMANRLGIYADRQSDLSRRLSADEIIDDLRERIAIITTGGTRSGQVQATIVRVGFEAPTAQMSAAVTNEIVTMILQENVAIRTNVAGQTLEFFTEEVAKLDQELAELGARILAFQEENLDALPDSLDFRRSQQAAAQERLVQLEREEATLIDRRARLVSLYESTGQVPASSQAPESRTVEERQLQALKDELSRATAVLSPTNPRVRVLTAQIEALEETVAAQAGARDAADSENQGLSLYEIQLADLDGQLDFIAAQKQQIDETMAALQASIEATPGNAIILDGLERDYANIRSQYDQAVANQARAVTGDTLEALAKGQRITVIEQAIAPREPESPNRPLLAAGGVALGIMAGLAVIVLLELLNSSVRRPADLINGLGVMPLGTIPLIRTRAEGIRRRLILLAAFAIALGVVPWALWYVHTKITPLDILINQILSRLPI
ncbi:GumC family protein [Flavimaricola marinus]|uniref:Chain length determinant protein n=1 Tax=Flavimaricola marinus TaxID=1819565 RepID=A0A238LK89_9RHOB|nr:Wzz/FepE/Etk N-terminal domain-containing protein [Flavimaricola marinus]SMY09290.1 Chain length determinant protein [Flavimaricola marinus]